MVLPNFLIIFSIMHLHTHVHTYVGNAYMHTILIILFFCPFQFYFNTQTKRNDENNYRQPKFLQAQPTTVKYKNLLGDCQAEK